MGQARQRALNGTPSIGDNWKWAQRDFEERPVQFFNGRRHNFVHPVLKKLNKQMRRIEKKHEATNPKAVLTIAMLTDKFEKFSARRDKLIEKLNPLK
jgi:hypothetical protein